ncbi:FadR/GntR family transcriptional regulator [Pseudarthrobacter raffinosi]|uniref:FadR/GntR family transcriptional regulator n=1 Tax=Pseudarthrobacter raffinosi TaxID=2953651 RepID=UPI00208F9333|nr:MULTISPECIES: FCD domain-containing protein [unclassified Pseudarthrobacter]MCO4238051.1 FCD domain-containing protein [Pseudarthrobacter sp. MDT3-28]MCO4251638.1 FCD domain-containing protein [Pseudarthrobacter sp. MDT3-9]MCO4263329.1 FCD domain-containing protein [Pseudarthrobacter sp. MDT3-26]
MKTPKAESPTDRHTALVQSLGLAIAEGSLAPNSVVRLDELEAQHKVSRSVVREAARVLSSKGMLASRRRFGTVVQPEEAWNLYDPQVIRWRLASSRRLEQLQALNELRGAIEPQAARLAAERASWDAGSDLVSLAARLWAAGQRGEQEEFLRLDVEFHAAVLKASGNAMFAQLQNLVAEVLTGRTEHGLMPDLPHHEALQLHVDVASAIQRGEAGAAHAAMSRIVEQFAEEVGHIWSEHNHGKSPDASPQHTTPRHTTGADGAPQLPPSASLSTTDS